MCSFLDKKAYIVIRDIIFHFFHCIKTRINFLSLQALFEMFHIRIRVEMYDVRTGCTADVIFSET